MPQHRFQNLIKLLIALQLLLPSGAPWLHTLLDGTCCAHACGDSVSKSACSLHDHVDVHAHCGHAHPCSADQDLSDPAGPQQSPPLQPHDCSNCAICQAIAAPRMMNVVLAVAAAIETVEHLTFTECADPLLGFGLPPQCRAPPVA